MLLSADEKTLYVADGDVGARRRVPALSPIRSTRTAASGITARRCSTSRFGERGIEGMCLDSDGNIIACMGWKKSGSGADADRHLARRHHTRNASRAGRRADARAFGDADLGSLYLTAGDGGFIARRASGGAD